MTNRKFKTRIDSLRSERKRLSNKLSFYWSLYRSPETTPKMRKYIKEDIDDLSLISRDLAERISNVYNGNSIHSAINELMVDGSKHKRLLDKLKIRHNRHLSDNQGFHIDIRLPSLDVAVQPSIGFDVGTPMSVDDLVVSGVVRLLLCNPNL